MLYKLVLNNLQVNSHVIMSLVSPLAVHVVQKKINWGNKEAIVISDKQEKKSPPITPAVNEGEKKKRKSRQEAKEDKSLSKNSKRVAKMSQMIGNGASDRNTGFNC